MCSNIASFRIEGETKCTSRFYYVPLRCSGRPPCFSSIFANGDNFHDFMFASLEGKVLPKGEGLEERHGVSSLRQEFTARGNLRRANPFL